MFQRIGFSNRKLLASYWALAGIIALGVLISPSVAQPRIPTSNQGRQISLKDQLTAGLKAFTRSDKEFIDEVVENVNMGKLPERLVNSTFLWARERAARKSRSRELRPMVYFRPVLTIQAKRLGVKLKQSPKIVIARPGRPRPQ